LSFLLVQNLALSFIILSVLNYYLFVLKNCG
jgi:hypothetical protein